MHRFSSFLVAPLLAALRPRVLVEVGAGRGRLTEAMLAADAGVEVHAVDPVVSFDAAKMSRAHGSRLHFHAKRSSEILDSFALADVAILDGDPNFATVRSDLDALASLPDSPVVVVHHTEWPFGRRDGYYDPGRLAPSDLNDPVSAGLVPGHSEPAADGLRLLPHVAATDEGDRNGVRRAVTRFVEDNEAWTAVRVSGLHGASILCARRSLESKPGLPPFLTYVRSRAFLDEQIRVLERERISALIAGVADDPTNAAESARR